MKAAENNRVAIPVISAMVSMLLNPRNVLFCSGCRRWAGGDRSRYYAAAHQGLTVKPLTVTEYLYRTAKGDRTITVVAEGCEHDRRPDRLLGFVGPPRDAHVRNEEKRATNRARPRLRLQTDGCNVKKRAASAASGPKSREEPPLKAGGSATRSRSRTYLASGRVPRKLINRVA